MLGSLPTEQEREREKICKKDTFANGQLGSKAYRVKFVVPIHAHLDPAHKGLMLLVEAARAEAVKETLPHGGWVFFHFLDMENFTWFHQLLT